MGLSTAVTRTRNFLALSGEKKTLALELAGLLVFTVVSFSLMNARWTHMRLRRWSDRRSVSPPEHPEALLLAAPRGLLTVKRIAGIEGSCLSRSLALWAALRRRGIETELTIGYRNREGKIEGHAWLEFSGAPVNEEPAVIATYTRATRHDVLTQPTGQSEDVRWV